MSNLTLKKITDVNISNKISNDYVFDGQYLFSQKFKKYVFLIFDILYVSNNETIINDNMPN